MLHLQMEKNGKEENTRILKVFGFWKPMQVAKGRDTVETRYNQHEQKANNCGLGIRGHGARINYEGNLPQG